MSLPSIKQYARCLTNKNRHLQDKNQIAKTNTKLATSNLNKKCHAKSDFNNYVKIIYPLNHLK